MASNDQFISPNYLLIECPIGQNGTTTKQKYTFPTQQQLQDRLIVGIEAFSSQDITTSPISNTPVITPAIFNNCFVRLYLAQNNRYERQAGLQYDQVPLCRMRITENADSAGVTAAANLTAFSRVQFRMLPGEIDWTKSEVVIPNNVTISQTYSLLLGIHYLEPAQIAKFVKYYEL